MILSHTWQNMYKGLVVVILLSVCTYPMQAQELNCTVKVSAPNLTGVDPAIFPAMQKAIYDLMNNRKWTNDNFSTLERIECTINISITKVNTNTDFLAQLSVQSNRPVFNSAYKSVMLNMLDQDCEIEYQQGVPLQFNENGTNVNLISMLAYYADIIIGYDYDTFSPKGGTPYFQKAQDIVNLCINNTEPGWSPFKSNRNRYWLVNNILDPKFDDVRKAYYTYHRTGVDKMYDKADDGRAGMLAALTAIDKVYSDNPFSYYIQQFFAAKADEIAGAFSMAPSEDKAAVYALVTHMDASNASKYSALQK